MTHDPDAKSIWNGKIVINWSGFGNKFVKWQQKKKKKKHCRKLGFQHSFSNICHALASRKCVDHTKDIVDQSPGFPLSYVNFDEKCQRWLCEWTKLFWLLKYGE